MSAESPAAEFEDPRRMLQRHGLHPKESFGQCFLIAPPIADAIVAALAPRSDETVVEIGTGCGTLARMIAPHARHVIAIERDRDLVAALRTESLAGNIELVEADAATFDYQQIAAREPMAIVGNLPYQITGKLLRALLLPPVRWRAAVVMVQKEVAARWTAVPGGSEWGVSGVFVQAACEVTWVLDASPRCFHPPPRVTSTVVKLTPRPKPLADETEAFRAVVHALFGARRKTILNGLTRAAGVSRVDAAMACERAGLDTKRRPETLSVGDFATLAAGLPNAREPR